MRRRKRGKRSLALAILALVFAMASVLAGCGASKGSSGTTSKQATMAQVCASHPEDVGTIAAGLVAYKLAMDEGNIALLTPGITQRVTGAVSDLRSAAVGATSGNLEAMRHFLEELEFLSQAFARPPRYPTAYVGDQNVATVKAAGKQAGCSL